MSQPFLVNADRSHALLRQAAKSRTLVAIDYRIDGQWVHRKSRLTGIDPQESLLLVDVPPGAGGWARHLNAGSNLSLSFRHGHRKYVFTTSVVDLCEATPSGRQVLRLLWPDELHELQRRLYYRTAVPDGRTIPVDLWITGTAEANRAAAMPQRGRMLDLSGGGLSLELPGNVRLPCRENDLVTCRFAAEPSRAPLEVPTRLRHTDRLADGRTRVGLQFVGLDASDEGRRTLQRIQRLTARLRGSETR